MIQNAFLDPNGKFHLEPFKEGSGFVDLRVYDTDSHEIKRMKFRWFLNDSWVTLESLPIKEVDRLVKLTTSVSLLQMFKDELRFRVKNHL